MAESEQMGQGWAPPSVTVLDPGQVQVRVNAQGELELRLSGGEAYTGVKIVPAFPISRPNRFVYFQDAEGKEIGLLIEPRRLDRESRELVLQRADEAYFMPRIVRIERVEEKPGTGIARWEVETDRGWNSFEMVSRSESVWFVGRNRLVIRDADGNRYLIEDLGELDRRSRRLAELYL
ncbi:MAG: DUF1854 domain-containing protein [Armatimonadota bacterium]